jgi:hypothetical protein
MRMTYKEARDQGLCGVCRRRDAEPGKARCAYCADHANRWAASDKGKASIKKQKTKLVKEIRDHYGHACACCGEDQPEFLTLDHIDGGGTAHRRGLEGNKSALGVYRDLRKKGFPAGYQTLCWNCNLAKAIFGVCPHQT